LRSAVAARGRGARDDVCAHFTRSEPPLTASPSPPFPRRPPASPRRLVAPHLERLLQSKGTSVAEYLGRKLHRRFVLGAASSPHALGSLLEQYEADLDDEDRQLLRAMHG
jgi:hypothetical protein